MHDGQNASRKGRLRGSMADKTRHEKAAFVGRWRTTRATKSFSPLVGELDYH
ncbi:hypothetical protein B4113_3943 [Geobacillus sp. B4113_201601]|nr:hypothetical protein B4113_3943 [Geobacillus sp. B4113_201601]